MTYIACKALEGISKVPIIKFERYKLSTYLCLDSKSDVSIDAMIKLICC